MDINIEFEIPQNIYTIDIVVVNKNSVRLIDSKEFYSNRKIEEITYWKDNRCITIRKFNPNEIETKHNSTGKRK